METDSNYAKGIQDGIRYWELRRPILTAIYNAAKEKNASEKIRILSGVESQIPHIYRVIENSPEPKELKKRQEDLEYTAEQYGFTMTEKGFYLSDKQ